MPARDSAHGGRGARWRRPKGCAAAFAAVLLALAPQATRSAAGPARGRKLINLQTQTTKYFHQPLVNCLNYTEMNYVDPKGVMPGCCALSAMECATRCDSVPGCLGFKYAWYMNAQPTAQAAPNPAPPEQQWTWCLLMSWFEISSCSAELRWDPSANFTQVRPQDIFDTYYKQATNSTPQAGSWTLFYDAWAAATAQNVTANATDSTGYKLPVVVGLSVGLGAPLALALAAVAFLLLCMLRRRLPGVGAGRSREWQPDPSRKHDVFLSYRRKELAVADQVHDKLTLAGLRVFYDRGGAMAGRPFEQELFVAIRNTPVFASVIMMEDVQRWAEHDVSAADFTLAEIIIALHFARTGRVRLIFPLLVGEPVAGTTGAAKGERDYLFSNAQFKTARAALPAVVPTATLALVTTMFKQVGGGDVLSPELASATVRDLILGPSAGMPGGGMHAKAPAGAGESAAAGRRQDELVAISVQDGASRLRGILEMDAVFLYGPDEQAGLVLRYRYAGSIIAALADDAARRVAGGKGRTTEAASPEDVSLAV